MPLNRVGVPLFVVLAACRTAAVPDQKIVATAGNADASVAAPADAGALSTEVSPFVPIVHAGDLRLERITGSPVLALDPDSNLVWALEASGTPRLVEPLALRVIASERPPFIDLGRIAGRWPVMNVELGYGASRGEPTIHNFLVDDEKQTLKTFTGPFGHIASSSPWLDGTELAFAAPATSLQGVGSFSSRNGSFRILGGPKRAVPKIPKTLASDRPVIAAYDTGRIFFLAGTLHEAPDYLVDEKMVWSFLGASVMPMPLKGPATRLVRGRTETETLVAGAEADGPSHDGPAYLARFDGTAWTDVPLPFREPIRAVAAGDDGTVWIASGDDRTKRSFEGGSLWRAAFPDLRFERVPLPAGLAPFAVGATSAADAWVVAADPTAPLGATLLHTQATPVAKVEDLPTGPVDVARLTIGKREPAPWTPDCRFGFLSFGKETERTSDELIAFGKAEPDWPWFRRLLLARLPSGDKLWGAELYEAYPKTLAEDVASARTLLKHAQSKFKEAKLLCTALPFERDLEVVPEPPRAPICRVPPSGAPPKKK